MHAPTTTTTTTTTTTPTDGVHGASPQLPTTHSKSTTKHGYVRARLWTAHVGGTLASTQAASHIFAAHTQEGQGVPMGDATP